MGGFISVCLLIMYTVLGGDFGLSVMFEEGDDDEDQDEHSSEDYTSENDTQDQSRKNRKRAKQFKDEKIDVTESPSETEDENNMRQRS